MFFITAEIPPGIWYIRIQTFQSSKFLYWLFGDPTSLYMESLIFPGARHICYMLIKNLDP